MNSLKYICLNDCVCNSVAFSLVVCLGVFLPLYRVKPVSVCLSVYFILCVYVCEFPVYASVCLCSVALRVARGNESGRCSKKPGVITINNHNSSICLSAPILLLRKHGWH